MKNLLYSISVSVLAFVSFSAAALESYSPRIDVDPKTIIIRGSGTVEILLNDWMRDFSRYHPHVKFNLVAKGSSKAVKALLEGEADLGPMSRKMKREESRAFRSQFGYHPTRVTVASDALAVVVNPKNPIKNLSLEDLDALFSATRKCGARRDVSTWGDLDAKGIVENQEPVLLGRSSDSGTYVFFRKKALCRGDYKATISVHDSKQIVELVKSNPSAVGYIGLGFLQAGIKVVKLPSRYGTNFVAPVMDSSKLISYPLSRHLYIYLNLGPDQELDSATKEFFRYIYSKQGQEAVTKQGFISLGNHTVKANYNVLKMLD